MDVGMFLDRVLAWASERDDVRAVVLLGSQARTDTPADRWSDVDLLLVVDDPAPFIAASGWLAPLGAPLLSFVEPTGIGVGLERRVLFVSDEEADFAVFPLEALPVTADAGLSSLLRRGYQVLLDRADVAARLAALAEQEPPLEERDLVQLSNDFWYHALWTAQKLRRGEVWIAWRSCNSYLQGCIVTLAGWRASLTGLDTWHGGRFLERWVDSATLARLRDAGARYDAVDVARGLEAVAALFADIERDYAAAAGVEVPVDQHEVRRRLSEVLTR